MGSMRILPSVLWTTGTIALILVLLLSMACGSDEEPEGPPDSERPTTTVGPATPTPETGRHADT